MSWFYFYVTHLSFYSFGLQMCLHTLFLSKAVPELNNLQCNNEDMHCIKIFT